MKHKATAIVIVIIIVLLLTLGGQCHAADSLWDPWLSNLAERVRESVQSNQNRYPFFKQRLSWLYNIPNLSLDDVEGDAVISRDSGELIGYHLFFNDEDGNGQFWSTSPSRFVPSKSKPDLGKLPQGKPFQISNRTCSITLRKATFSRACTELRKLGVKLVVRQRPTKEARRTIRLFKLPLRQIVGQTFSSWKMEARQSGEAYLVVRKPITADMDEAQAINILNAMIQSELARHGLTEIDEAGMTDEFIARLAFAIDKLPPQNGVKASWRLKDLPRADQVEWHYLSVKDKVLRQANALCEILRAQNGE